MTPERHTTFQTQVGIELLFDCLFTFLSYLLYKTVKYRRFLLGCP